MSIGTYLAVAAAASLGAVARAWTDVAVARLLGRPGPAGVLSVNALGAATAGALAAAAATLEFPAWFVPVVAAGFLGTYTTFSSWMLAALQAGRSQVRVGIGVIVAGVATGAVAVWAGWALATVLL